MVTDPLAPMSLDIFSCGRRRKCLGLLVVEVETFPFISGGHGNVFSPKYLIKFIIADGCVGFYHSYQ
jgi:hypothetical protein